MSLLYSLFKIGYDKEGYNKTGYDRSGYDKDGYNKAGYDRKGYDREGYNKDGYDRKGYDKYGYNENGYNVAGYTKEGYNEEGFNKAGYDKEGYDRAGYNRDGYNRNGYNNLGYNKEGYTELGYDKEGYDKEGYNKEGYSKEGYNRKGFDKDGFNKHKEKYFEILKEYEQNKKESEFNLALCYLNEIGVKKDEYKAFSIAVEGAYKSHCEKCLRMVKAYLKEGIVVNRDLALVAALEKINQNHRNNVLKAMESVEFSKKGRTSKEKDFADEEEHLRTTVSKIDNLIEKKGKLKTDLDESTWFMDYDQKAQWNADKIYNEKVESTIEDLIQIKNRPYYARMDTKIDGKEKKYYIAERVHIDFITEPNNDIVSVWSEYGRRYRDRTKFNFTINDYDYEVILRRRMDIKNAELIEIYNDYIQGVSDDRITDPYLIKILEEKKHEKSITNIIRSIQQNQNNIIDYDFKKNIVVQGCAGSGKTMILLHRLANMKYNMPNLDLSKIKIITPNKQFTMYIDELSKNLEIDKIEKLTINEYYATLMIKYRERFTKIKKTINQKGEEEIKHILTGETYNELAKTFENDHKLDKKIVAKIYSDEFATKLVKECQALNEENKGKDYETALNTFDYLFNNILSDEGVTIKITRNYTAILYAKLLFLFTYYGSIGDDQLLCVDEGQDISKLQYLLLKRVNKEQLKFNIYGDLNQQIPEYCGIGSWKDIIKFIDAEYFELNENYRNSDNIIEFYNKKLNLNNQSFGLKTKEVLEVRQNNVLELLKIQLLLNNRVALICKDTNQYENSDLDIFSSDISCCNKVSLLSVKEAKGLEFDTVFVIEDNMDLNERYISYTRALSELYIVK